MNENLEPHKQNKKFHYAWFVALGAGLVIFYQLGLGLNCISIYLNPLMESLGASNTLRSSMTAFFQFGSAASFLVMKRIMDKIGIRRLILVTGLAMAGGFMVLAFARNIVICYMAMFCMGMGYGAGGSVATSFVVAEWFDTHRGAVQGLVTTTSGLATIVAPGIISKVIEARGVHFSFGVQSLVIFGMVMLAFILIKDSPEKCGLKPYGAQESAETKETKAETPKNIPIREIITSKKYLPYGICMFFIGVVISPTISHISPFITQSGFATSVAVTALSMYGFIMLFSKPILGFLVDKFGIKTVQGLLIGILIATYGCGILMSRGGSSAFAYAMPIFMGSGLSPMITTFFPLWTVQVFGKEVNKSVLPILKICYNLGGMIGASVPGIVFDHTGAYTALFMGYIPIGVVACTVLLIMFKRRGLATE